MITRRTFLASLAAGVSALALTGCQIDTRTPIRVSQILEVIRSGVPSPVAAAINGQFVTPPWCQDEGAMAVETISTPDVPLQLQSCAPGGPGAIGTFQMNTSLIKTDGGQTDAVILANVLGNDNARFAVFKHEKHGRDLLSVGLFLTCRSSRPTRPSSPPCRCSSAASTRARSTSASRWTSSTTPTSRRSST